MNAESAKALSTLALRNAGQLPDFKAIYSQIEERAAAGSMNLYHHIPEKVRNKLYYGSLVIKHMQKQGYKASAQDVRIRISWEYA